MCDAVHLARTPTNDQEQRPKEQNGLYRTMDLNGCPNLSHVSVTSILPPGNPEGRQLWMTIGLCTGQLLTDVAAKQIGCWHHSLYMEEGGFSHKVKSILIILYHAKNQGRKEGKSWYLQL